jgi:hypothetical protein
MKYDFSALDGIIFGIRTPATDKIKIIEIIERKCKEAGRTDFNFYQAVQTRTGEIECVRLRGISEMVARSGPPQSGRLDGMESSAMVGPLS